MLKRLVLLLLISSSASAMTLMYETGSPKTIDENVLLVGDIPLPKEHEKITFFNIDDIYTNKSVLTEGYVKDKYIASLKDVQPFFVVGFGDESVKWLYENKQKLKSINALGYAINVKSKVQYLALSHAYDGELVVTNLDEFIHIFGLKHYPFLIANGRVEQ